MELQVIQTKIHTIRGERVMLDFVLAELYEVETKVLKQAVRRNMERFPDEFMFELTPAEFKNLRSQIVTSSWGGTRYPPFAFTEHGVAMLSSVLNSPKAIQTNITIIKAFITLRRYAMTFDELAAKIISILESLVGHSGWLKAVNLRVESIEPEDYVLLCAVTEQGRVLDMEQCNRLFSLPATEEGGNETSDRATADALDARFNQLLHDIVQENTERNAHFFDEEMDKLDHWAEDVKNSLEIELRNLEQEIKARKTEARKILNLQEKVQEQRRIKDLEKRRTELRHNLYQAQDEVDDRKEDLIQKIEQRMHQRITLEELFSVYWTIL